MSNVLVVAAHPDDEVLGGGGSFIRHVEEGDTVSALILGQGIMSRENGTEDMVNVLHTATKLAAKIIGFSNVFLENFPDNAFDSVPLLEITKVIEKYLDKVQPDILYTHFHNDLNIDHRRAFEAVLTACRPCNGNAPRDIYTFETLSSTEWQSKINNQFQPTVYRNIDGTIEKKIKALQCYASEMRAYPHSRSYEGVRILAQYRGLEAAMPFAEAFCLVRSIGK